MTKRKSILIVDDEEMSRELLKQMFEGEYNIITAKDGKEAIQKLGQNIDTIAVVLLDLVMPVLNGFQVLQVLNAKRIVERIPVVLITAQKDTKVELSCYTLGASAVISKPFVAQVVRMQVNNIVDMHRKADEMENTIQSYQAELAAQQEKLNRFYDHLLDAISNIVEFRDLETGEHVQRVRGFTRIMGQAVMELFPERES
jgi:putative two-component system response regulator